MSPPPSLFFLCCCLALSEVFQPLKSHREWRPFPLGITIFIELFDVARCNAANPITHFTLTTRYNESITKWSMKGFRLCLLSPQLQCNHGNKARINLLFSEMTQESPSDLIICFAPFLHFPLYQFSAEMIWEKWIACLIPGFTKAMWVEMEMITI